MQGLFVVYFLLLVTGYLMLMTCKEAGNASMIDIFNFENEYNTNRSVAVYFIENFMNNSSKDLSALKTFLLNVKKNLGLTNRTSDARQSMALMLSERKDVLNLIQQLYDLNTKNETNPREYKLASEMKDERNKSSSDSRSNKLLTKKSTSKMELQQKTDLIFNHKRRDFTSSTTEDSISHLNVTQNIPFNSNLIQRKSKQTKNGVLSPSDRHEISRSRRDVLLLYNVVACATKCNPLKLMGYGCYCGYQGAGIPVDNIDRCCQMHDNCYNKLPCPQSMLYFIPYKWTCYRGKPLCYGKKGYWNQSSNCGYRMCECDRLFGECLRRLPCPTTKPFCKSTPLRALHNFLSIGIGG